MATFEDLENEVQKLRRTVRRLEGGNAAAANVCAVDKIVNKRDRDERLITSGGGVVPGDDSDDD